jgi:hypothetical protein
MVNLKKKRFPEFNPNNEKEIRLYLGLQKKE